RRLVRLVVRRQRSVLEPLRDVEPPVPVGLHDERVVAPDRVRAGRTVRRHVVGRLLLVEVRRVRSGPLLLLAVPPDVALALRPWIPLRIGRRAVVEHPPVRGPGPRPLERRVALLPVRLPARRLVLAVAED